LYELATPSVLFDVFMNIALYLLFTVICFFTARPPMCIATTINPILADSSLAQRYLPRFLRRIITVKRMSREQTIAVCFCGAAKTTSLGIPLVTAMWKDADNQTRAFIQIPVLLYTIEQVLLPPYFTLLLLLLHHLLLPPLLLLVPQHAESNPSSHRSFRASC
jgi:solute carrier family 10 (sodium/bile acid cotransporter), member 7